MTDRRYRIAERAWQTEADYFSWINWLRESRRVGKPLFTEALLHNLLMVGCQKQEELDPLERYNIQYQDTDDGFVVDVNNARNPLIETLQSYRVPHGYESDYFELWNRWSGQLKLCWTTDFEPPCPGLELEAAAWQQPGGGYYVVRDPEPPDVYIYESGCVTTAEQLQMALCDVIGWTLI